MVTENVALIKAYIHTVIESLVPTLTDKCLTVSTVNLKPSPVLDTEAC